jgi:formate hydrogenlyase transcriptional activator
VRTGLFRSDLFYRLNVLPVRVPALRERQTDIPQILMFFRSHYSKRMGKRIEAISPDTMERLVNYSWPGNIRELRNVIERGVVLSPSSAITLGLDLLPPEISNLDSVGGAVPLRRRAADGAVQAPRKDAPRRDAPPLEELERQHILKVLEQAGWKISGPKGAAEILKIHPNTLRDRINKLGISRPGHGTP